MENTEYEPKTLLCPMMKMRGVNGFPTFHHCMEEYCAWWFDYGLDVNEPLTAEAIKAGNKPLKGRCAISEIGVSLSMIQDIIADTEIITPNKN